MQMTVPQRLAALREKMKQTGIDAFLVPTDDFHGSEYVGEYFKCRKYITGFTGSAGTALIMQDMAGLWTDGRYFLQAAQQLEGSGITLFRMRDEGVPTIEEFLGEKMKDGMVLGFDGRTMTAAGGAAYRALLKKNGASLRADLDLVGEIWAERPSMSKEPAWLLDVRYAGESAADKIERVRQSVREQGADTFLLTSLDDIAWLLNIRGNDVACNPVVLSYLLLGEDFVTLYAAPEAFDEKVRDALAKEGVSLKKYMDIYDDVKAVTPDHSVLLDPGKVNYSLRAMLREDVPVIEADNPTLLMKACKNPVEAAHMADAHIKDGAAVTCFIHWLKTRAGKEEITELSAAVKLEEFRRAQKDYLGPSFDPIIAYREHAAIMHYSATEESSVPIKKEGMLLADTGGQYLDGTTDITRTIVLGEISDKEKEFFTRVLRGNLNLGAAHFLYGCSGMNFDYLAREPLWEIGEDYNHGTGHGVGFVLNVHEAPNSFHYRTQPGRRAQTVMEEGMVTSNEPGYYLPGEFGIRHENLVICKKADKQPCGQFMCFETLTLVPFDLDGILPEMMSEKEKKRLNDYHRRVYETIGPRVPEDVREWLREATRPI